MTDFTITYENNIFYCTKNNTKWISVDGEKWYGEEKRITELEKENAELKNKLTEKVTLESLDVVSAKMNDLEKENAELKHNKKTVVHLADCLEEKMKERIEELEQQIEKMKCCENCQHFKNEEDVEYCWNCERQQDNDDEIIKDEWEIKE